MQQQRRLGLAGTPGRFALLSLLPGVGWRFGLWALGPWIGDDVRRSGSGTRTAQQQGRSRSRSRRRQETQCTGEADLAGDAVPQLCRERWKSTMGMAKGQAGWGSTRRTMDCSLSLPASAWRAGARPWRRERGELVWTTCKCVRANALRTSTCDGRRA